MGFSHLAYKLGAEAAAEQVGVDPAMLEGADPAMAEEGIDPAMAEEGAIPPELLALMAEQGLTPEDMAQLLAEAESGEGVTSEDFVDFAQEDGTLQDEEGLAVPEEGTADQKDPHWSGQVSMEGGDSASRISGMGTKPSGAV